MAKDISERRVKAVDAAEQWAKLLITLSTGAIALSGTFIKDVFGNDLKSSWAIVVSWCLFTLSIFFGVFHIGSLVSLLNSRFNSNVNIDNQPGRAFGTLQGVLFFLAIIFFAIFSSVNILNNEVQDTSGIETYFEKIRGDEPTLTAFFSAMPKGGDLHNHFSGSIYAETYWQHVVENAFLIDTISLEIQSLTERAKKNKSGNFVSLNSLASKNRLNIYKQRLIKEWSIKDYDNVRPSHMHFFESFNKFPHGDREWDEVSIGLKELVERAATENVQYLEVMLKKIRFDVPKQKQISNDSLRSQLSRPDTVPLYRSFERLTKHYDSSGGGAEVEKYLKCLHDTHDKISSSTDVVLRYLAFVTREQEPLEVFKELAIAFQAAAQSPLIVGVNIVQREDGRLSMKDYKLHMRMFRYLRSKYPGVKCSLHAGELTLGLVKPEDLSFHINDAVFVARANRIGHGVDVAHEKDALRLLRYMSSEGIPVEINLSSNEFILKVTGEEHPITLYKKQNVPIIISTDDAGILRTNLTHQYVLLAQRYPGFSYEEIKGIIINTLEYSFIEEVATKDSVKNSLLQKLALFEKEIIASNTMAK